MLEHDETIIYRADVATPLGMFRLAATDRGLCALLLPRSSDEGWLRHMGPHRVLEGAVHPALKQAETELKAYLQGELQQFNVPLDLRGTPFQLQVWGALQQIPYGETRTYGQIAAMVGNPRGVRAVGMANNRNPVAIIVPCHRVIGANGSLVGYGGGLPLKEHLLALERSGMAQAAGQ
ncbi:MAG: methylated-DNA--[protein]-cysteine S-methyltransferase [Bacillota bacterium]